MSEWVLVSNLRHLSLYTLDKRRRMVIKDQGRVKDHIIVSSCNLSACQFVSFFFKLVSFQLVHLGACELV